MISVERLAQAVNTTVRFTDNRNRLRVRPIALANRDELMRLIAARHNAFRDGDKLLNISSPFGTWSQEGGFKDV